METPIPAGAFVDHVTSSLISPRAVMMEVTMLELEPVIDWTEPPVAAARESYIESAEAVSTMTCIPLLTIVDSVVA